MIYAPTPVALVRRTRTVGVTYDGRRFTDTCALCGHTESATTSGMLSGWFGAHHGADGSTPTCPEAA